MKVLVLLPACTVPPPVPAGLLFSPAPVMNYLTAKAGGQIVPERARLPLTCCQRKNIL